MPPPPFEVTLAGGTSFGSAAPPVPRYLEQVYWWAYVHPKAVHLFEREWLVNAILFNNYGRLRDAALADLGQTVQGRIAAGGQACWCNPTPRLQERLASDAQLDVVDILLVQLANPCKKLPADERVTLKQMTLIALDSADAQYDQVLLFFLLHEMPEAVRRQTLSEAMRVLKPGGRMVIVDYHRPVKLHPLRPLMRQVFRHLEPYAMDLWGHEVESFLPAGMAPVAIEKKTYFRC